MKIKYLLFLFLSFSALLIQSCAFCGKDQAGRFHPEITIVFENENGEGLISPIGLYHSFSSVLYDEAGVQVDTSFSNLDIRDWNERWKEENVKYSRQYELHLISNITEEKSIYDLDINYWGEINNCDNYEINRIQMLVNDSLQIDNDFFSNLYYLILPE